MRLLPAIAAASLLATACGTPPCQELGERLCACTGLSKESCKTQVEDHLKNHDPGDAVCEHYLASCHEDAGTVFCEWLGTEAGKQKCGIAPPPPPPPP